MVAPLYSYLVSFLLDSTVGLLIIYVLLKAVAWVVSRYQITPLVSGEYGMKSLDQITTYTYTYTCTIPLGCQMLAG